MLYQYRYFNCIRKKDDVYKIIAEDVEARFDTSNYELNRRLPQQKNKKVIGLMKEELSHKIMTKFVGLRAKAYSFLIDDSDQDKKAKGTTKCVMKNPKFENCKDCVEAAQLDNNVKNPEKRKLM